MVITCRRISLPLISLMLAPPCFAQLTAPVLFSSNGPITGPCPATSIRNTNGAHITVKVKRTQHGGPNNGHSDVLVFPLGPHSEGLVGCNSGPGMVGNVDYVIASWTSP